MKEISFYSLEKIGLIEQGDNLPEKILETCKEEDFELKDNDVVIITSKVVSMYEGRIVNLKEVEPSSKAKAIAESTGMLEEEVELILQEGEVLAAIPVSKFGQEYILRQADNKEKAKEALDNIPSMLLTERNGRICTSAGVDLSNSPEGKATLLPEDPNKSAKKIKKYLEDKTNKELAVIITDSEVSIRGGSTDIAIGCSGIVPVDSKFGTDDLFGKPKFGGVDLIADEIAGAAALHFGQTSEKIPVVIGRGIEYAKGEGITGNYSLVNEGMKNIILSGIKIKFQDLFY
ncbi:MAG: coenzyme F420-0:L-glutamate ligase [Bacillota bacterium]